MFLIPLTMGFLPGCGENKIIDCPISTAMVSWRKFENMIDIIDHPNSSRVCAIVEGQLLVVYCRMLRINLKNVRFMEQLNYTLSTKLVVLKTLYTFLVKVELFTTPCIL